MEEPIQLPKIVKDKTLSSKNLRDREDKASMETIVCATDWLPECDSKSNR